MAAEQVHSTHYWGSQPPGLVTTANNQVIQPAPPVPLYSVRPARAPVPSKKTDECLPSRSVPASSSQGLPYDLEALDSLLASSVSREDVTKKKSGMPGTSRHRGRPKGSLNKKESRTAMNLQKNAESVPKANFDSARLAELNDRIAVGERSEIREYKCKLCPLRFFNRSDVVMHSRAHTEGKPYKCAVCSKGFASTSYLNQHARIHSGVKPYHCSYCEKTFRQLSHLQQHTRTHTGQRPYRCSHAGCSKAFTQLSNLQQHWRRHNKDKPYKCPDCYRAFDVLEKLQNHVQSHENTRRERKFACSVCGKTYVQELYLEKHLASKHPRETVMEQEGLPSQVPYKRLPSTTTIPQTLTTPPSQVPYKRLPSTTPQTLTTHPSQVQVTAANLNLPQNHPLPIPKQPKVESVCNRGPESSHNGVKGEHRISQKQHVMAAMYPQVHFPLFNAGYPSLPGFSSLRS